MSKKTAMACLREAFPGWLVQQAFPGGAEVWSPDERTYVGLIIRHPTNGRWAVTHNMSLDPVKDVEKFCHPDPRAAARAYTMRTPMPERAQDLAWLDSLPSLEKQRPSLP